MNDIIVSLIGTEYVPDSLGQQTEKTTKTTVYATRKSIGSNEFFKAGQAGLKPSFVVTIYNAEYDGQTKAEINGKIYYVYRTYIRKDMIELYLTERAGGQDNYEAG